jgi:AcrR family transcriptional regulator
VTLDAIAQHVGVTKPALYSYFRNREDLLREVMYEVFGNIRSSLEPTLAQENDIHRLIRNIADLFFEHQEASANLFFQIPIRLIHDLQSREDFVCILNDCRRLLSASLRQAQSEGTLSREIDPDESTIAIIMMAMGISGSTLMIELDMAATKKIWIASVERILLLEPGAE